jgi:hypothetical protein
MVLPPIPNNSSQGDLALSASQGRQKTPTSSKSSAQPEPKKRKVAEVALASWPKAGSTTASSQPAKVVKQDPKTQAMQYQSA